MNMHDNKVDLVENLFCNHIPFTKATCRSIKNGNKTAERKNIGRTHGYEYERLITRAHLQGKIKVKNHKSVYHLADRVRALVVKHKIFANETDYPRICADNVFLDDLLRVEMEQERANFPEWYESPREEGGGGGDVALKRDFEAAARTVFCPMDEDQILESGVLEPVLRELS